MALKIDMYGFLVLAINTKSTGYTVGTKTSSALIRSSLSLLDWTTFSTSTVTLTTFSGSFLGYAGNHDAISNLVITSTSFPNALTGAQAFTTFT